MQRMMRRVHVMHARPVVAAGLAALLRADDWVVSEDSEEPRGLALANVVVTDYETAAGVAHGAARVIIVTQRDREWEVRRMLEAGVKGYLLEDAPPAQLRFAVREVMNGSSYLCPAVAARIAENLQREPLTGRESDVLRLLARGMCNKLIARDLGIGVGTVKTHVRGLMGKLGATARTHAVVVAAQRGLVGIDGVEVG